MEFPETVPLGLHAPHVPDILPLHGLLSPSDSWLQTSAGAGRLALRVESRGWKPASEVSLESASQGQPPQLTNSGFPTSELRIRSSPWRWPALIPVGVMSLCLQKTSAGRFSVGHLCGPLQVELLPFLLYCNEIRLSRSREPVSLGFICWAKGTSLI